MISLIINKKATLDGTKFKWENIVAGEYTLEFVYPSGYKYRSLDSDKYKNSGDTISIAVKDDEQNFKTRLELKTGKFKNFKSYNRS